MKSKSLRSYFVYFSFIICLINFILNHIFVPFLSDFSITHFSIFSSSLVLLGIARLIGVSNEIDLKIKPNKSIWASNTLLVILALELIISVNFQFLNHLQDRLFAFAICLTPSFGFILSRPFLRLHYLEVKIEKMEKRDE